MDVLKDLKAFAPKRIEELANNLRAARSNKGTSLLYRHILSFPLTFTQTKQLDHCLATSTTPFPTSCSTFPILQEEPILKHTVRTRTSLAIHPTFAQSALRWLESSLVKIKDSFL